MRIKLDIPLDISEIENTITSLPSGYTGKIEYIVTDSREARERDLYFALDGDYVSGEDYVPDILSIGAVPVTASSKYSGIHVRSTKDALLSLSAYYLDKLEALKNRICITGSVGKTTTKEFLKNLTSTQFKTHSTIGNFNNDIGVPLTIFSAPKDTEIIILEIGTNHLGEIGRLSRHIKPTLGIITNIGTSHIGNLGSKELIAKEKASITEGMEHPSVLIEYGESLLSSLISGKTVSTESPLADFYLMPIVEDIGGTTFDFYSREEMLSGVRFNIAGRHMLSCLSMAISAALTIGVTRENVMAAVPRVGEESVRHRLVNMDGYAILDDSYNSSRESVFADFRLMQFYKKFPLSALLGDILELGRDTETIHREIGAAAYRFGLSRLYLFGVYSIFIAEGAKEAGMTPECIHINTDIEHPEKTAEDILAHHTENEIILFKASHKLKLGAIIDILKSKGRDEKNA